MKYKYYTEPCVICGKELPKREMNKLFLSFGHSSVYQYKKLCCICDDCLPSLADMLTITIPENTESRVGPRDFCRKCYNTVGKTAVFCPHCGSKLRKEPSDER